MSKKFTAREIAEVAELIRYQRHLNRLKEEEIIQFEYQKGDRRGLLEKVRFARNESGRPTKKIIECIDNGSKRNYDRNYDFEITAFMIDGVRLVRF